MPASPTLVILPNAVVGVWLTAASSSTSLVLAATMLAVVFDLEFLGFLFRFGQSAHVEAGGGFDLPAVVVLGEHAVVVVLVQAAGHADVGFDLSRYAALQVALVAVSDDGTDGVAVRRGHSMRCLAVEGPCAAGPAPCPDAPGVPELVFDGFVAEFAAAHEDLRPVVGCGVVVEGDGVTWAPAVDSRMESVRRVFALDGGVCGAVCDGLAVQCDLAFAHAVALPWFPEALRIAGVLCFGVDSFQVEGLGERGDHKAEPWGLAHVAQHAVFRGRSDVEADGFGVPPPPAVDPVEFRCLIVERRDEQRAQCGERLFLAVVAGGGHHSCPPPLLEFLFRYSRLTMRAPMAHIARSILRFDSRLSLAMLMPTLVGWRLALSMCNRSLASPSCGKSPSVMSV